MNIYKQANRCIHVFFILLSLGCSHNEQPKESFLQADWVLSGVDLYDLISVTDSMVLGFSYPDSLLCRMYHLESSDASDIRAESFLRYGRAQNEMLQPLFYASNDELYAIECQGGPTKAIIIDLCGIEVDRPLYTHLDLSWIMGYSYFSSIYPISESLFLAISKTKNGEGLYRKEVLFLVDITNQIITPVNLTFEDNYGQEDLVKKIVYTNNANIFLNEKEGKLAYTCGEGRLFDIYKYNSGALYDRNRVLDILPRYKAEEHGGRKDLILLDKTNRGVRPSFTEEYICVAYNQSDEHETFKGFPGFYIDQIDVFDWNGQMVARFMMDKPFSTYQMSKDNRFIYTLSMDLDTGETEIRKYSIECQFNI